MNTTLSREIKVGIFTVVGIVLFCLSVILLGGDKFFFQKSYRLKIRLPQATGLGVGSVVSLSGVPVGNVQGIDFVEKSSDVEVTISLEQAVQNRVTEGSKASIKTQGALGDKYIFIQPGPIDAQPLRDGAILDTDRSPDFLDLIASKGAEMGEVVNVIKEVRILFENMNRDGRSGRLMSNLVDASGELSSFLKEGRETFRMMRTDAIVPMASVMKKIDRGDGTIGALINDPSLHNRISSFFGDQPRNRFLKPLIRESIETNEKKK
jgi:phospholipid/cholesterol/gamma-HCH transport system substrate-binding protein